MRKPLRMLAVAALLLAPLAPGPAAAASGSLADGYVIYEHARPVPDLPFKQRLDGMIRDVSLKDFAGKVVVLNFWATWCPPCVAEMPSLDRLQGDLGGEGIVVVALSEDRGGFAVVDPFYAGKGLSTLARYSDPDGRLARHFGIKVMPTTILIGPDGIPVGEIEGGAEWDSPEAKRLLQALKKH
ncbi:TlpA family protein disulfide reductase [Tistlia consotensis]|uniref:TlpA family protein disulfide reductase n=1 Tax=Tistlia consotensis TaxID=1321365 RepID=UPI001C530F14|nr:TlpA disulfide reductase family protein [Tistlia consotensis]